MKRKARDGAPAYINKWKRPWRRMMAALACGMALCTVYALILPAMTMEKDACQLPEHTHTDACYSQILTVQKRVPICSAQTLGIHAHTQDCYGSEGELVCGCVDAVVHTHDENCYLADGTLWCPLPEVPAHVHDEGCYGLPPDAHIHCEDCYTTTPGELTCTAHTHTEACYAQQQVLICGLEESEEHTHEESCVQEETIRVCGVEEDHSHTESCYAPVESLSCGFPEEPEKVLICAGETRPAHQHSDACFQIVQEPADTESLTCTDTAEDHRHTPLCYGTWELSCGMEEHIHDESCQPEQAETPEEDPGLKEDTAWVAELKVSPCREEMPGMPWFVRNGEGADYRVEIQMAAETDATYTRGRVRLEFVLPLSAQEGTFDENAMSWLEDAALTEQTRTIGEEELPCQVLTGYKTLLSENPEEPVIPGAFTETVGIRLLAAEPGRTVPMLVSAAMEVNTWEGICPTHQTEERLNVAAEGFTAACTAQEAQRYYEDFLGQLEELESQGTPEAETEAMFRGLSEAYQQGLLTQQAYEELYARLVFLLYGDPETMAESAIGTNWMALRDSGWFGAYSASASASRSAPLRAMRSVSSFAATGRRLGPSDVQVVDRGGSNANAADGVSVSKVIAGTELENVFDITLTVQTQQEITEISSEPDMAVVIVLDISNTMNSNFGGVTRYAAAMTAAEGFLDQFAQNNSQGISKVGFVAFNTNAMQIFPLQACASQGEANALKNTMRSETGSIINAADYNASHSRFTNIEAGLAMAADMLNGVNNRNKFIVFLSDGFPTTYISSGYAGYDPYDSSIFYDRVLNKPCSYGTSYSNEAAVRARNRATDIKGSGVTILSIGVDVGGQTIQHYVNQSEKANGFSVVERSGTTYEIGGAEDGNAYKIWLRDRIGSGYYYDSTDSAGLTSAFNQIFQQIRQETIQASQADWAAADPMPQLGSGGYVEFIGFYDQNASLTAGALTGAAQENGENTASFQTGQQRISWDLKQSGYTSTQSGDITMYTYQLVYRVRLKNEQPGFAEGTVYATNGETTLRYKVVQTVDGNTTMSGPKNLTFPIPSVQGYLSSLSFVKEDTQGRKLEGAEFTLRHADGCSICRGDGSSVAVADKTAVSDAQGTVAFLGIPSGHRYTLTETKAPEGYGLSPNTYQITVAYDAITVLVNGEAGAWDGKVVDEFYYQLPDTGGRGIQGLATAGLLLMGWGLLTLCTRRRKGGRGIS